MKIIVAVALLLCLGQAHSFTLSNDVHQEAETLLSIEDIMKQFTPVIEKILDKIAKISKEIGHGHIAEAIEAIHRALKDIENVQQAELLKRTSDINKKIFDAKRDMRNEGVEYPPCIDKLETDMRNHVRDLVKDFSACNNKALKHAEDLRVTLRELQVRLTTLDQWAKDIVTKCKTEHVNYALLRIVTCVRKEIRLLITELRDTTEKIRAASDEIIHDSKEIIQELRECNQAVLDDYTDRLDQIDVDIIKCSIRIF